MSSQFSQCPVSVLSSVHANESASSWWDQVNRQNLAVLAERIRQLLLLDQFAEMAHPQGGAANAQRLFLCGWQTSPLPVAFLFTFQTFLFPLLVSRPRSRPGTSVATPGTTPGTSSYTTPITRSRSRSARSPTPVTATTSGSSTT